MEPLRGSADRFDRQSGTRLLGDDEIESLIAKAEEDRAEAKKKKAEQAAEEANQR